ncbi:MAG TPA: OmpH family outer membrane protein [Caulobacteraceae bacterium]|jgi:outer membrane protein
MNARFCLIAGLAAGALVASASYAQTRGAARPAAARPAAAPSPSAAPMAEGPPIPGLCVWRGQQVAAASKVGQAVFARLRVLGSQINAELSPERDGINTAAKQLQGQQATMDQATLQAQAANLDLRKNNYVKKAQQRQQQLEATQAVQFDTIRKQLTPVITELYQQHHCSVLFDADQGAVSQVSPAMDLSRDAVAGLDAKIQTLTFDLMTPEQVAALAQQQQQQR